MSDNLTKVFAHDLRVGMRVCKLDRSWLDTPFIMQGFVVEDSEDVDTIAQYCEFVWVDNTEPLVKRSEGVQSSSHNQTRYSVSVSEEHKKTLSAFRQARSLTKSFLSETRLGATLDSDQAKNTVDVCVKSVLRHPDALLWMTKMREENDYTSDHCLNVCVLAVAFGRYLGIEEDKLQNLGLCGLLHDLGKMRVPESIVNKPGKLTDKEMQMMKAHTVHGRNLLSSSPHLYSGTIDVAYSHHERVDGKGYPRRLSGEKISRYAKIISIVDAYDAITAKRCYSPARTSSEALRCIYEERGKQFDEELAIAFIKMVGLYPPGSIVELSNGQVGLVMESNQHLKHLPKVMIILNKHKERLTQFKPVDLAGISIGDVSKDYLIQKVWLDGSFGLYIKDFQKAGLIFQY